MSDETFLLPLKGNLFTVKHLTAGIELGLLTVFCRFNLLHSG